MMDLGKAPESGRILAYATDRLIYDAYTLMENSIVLSSGGILDTDGIYELHMFDTCTEYRTLYSDGEWKTSVMKADDENTNDIDHFVFAEKQFVKKSCCVESSDEKIVVNNRFAFDEEGFLRLEDYRLAME